MTTGRCGSQSNCPGGALPYGLPGYGFRASFETQGAEGTRIRSSAVFVSSSCCGSLQLPFSTFGFGDFATYIENVTVSVPAPPKVGFNAPPRLPLSTIHEFAILLMLTYFQRFVWLRFSPMHFDLVSFALHALLVINSSIRY